MLSKRVMVVAGEKPLQRRLVAGAMAAGGSVQAFANTEELPARVDAELVLYALGWQLEDPQLANLLQRLSEETRVVPVLRASQLEWIVHLLANPRIAAVLVAEEMNAQSVSSTVSKILYGDLFGLEKVMPWGVRIYSVLVGDYQEKSLAIATIGDFAQAMGVRRKYRDQIDQCVDEMLMNALYDAPVDAEGKPLFAEVAVKDRVTLRLTEKAVVQYACDGDRFAVSVRDNFGSLQKHVVLSYLDKCLHANAGEQIDRKAGGAGLGLYLIANSATEVSFHVFEGTATEVVCTFDLTSARAQLRSFGVFEESVETAARPTASPTKTVATRPGRRREDLDPPSTRWSGMLAATMTFAVLLLITAVTLVALPYVRKPAAATLRIESEPPGATIYVDGRARGISPVTTAGLEAGRSYSVRAALPGHKEDDQLVTATVGESTIRLRLKAESAVIAVESEPPGARVLLDGHDTGKITPATFELEPGDSSVLTLEREGFATQKVAVTAPAAGERAVYRAQLPLSTAVGALTITAPEGATVFIDGMALMPPALSHQAFVKPGVAHHIKVSAPGKVDFREDVTVGAGERRTLQAELQEGGVLKLETNVVAKVFVDGKSVGTSPLAPITLSEGAHTILLRGDHVNLSRAVTIEKGKTLDEKLDLEKTSP